MLEILYRITVLYVWNSSNLKSNKLVGKVLFMNLFCKIFRIISIIRREESKKLNNNRSRNQDPWNI